MSALLRVLRRNIGQEEAFIRNPRGGCNIPPAFSQWPIGRTSCESTRRQKSFLLSPPSSRSRRRGPWTPTTVAMHVDVTLRGSRASSFIPARNSFLGGTGFCSDKRVNKEVTGDAHVLLYKASFFFGTLFYMFHSSFLCTGDTDKDKQFWRHSFE